MKISAELKQVLWRAAGVSEFVAVLIFHLYDIQALVLLS